MVSHSLWSPGLDSLLRQSVKRNLFDFDAVVEELQSARGLQISAGECRTRYALLDAQSHTVDKADNASSVPSSAEVVSQKRELQGSIEEIGGGESIDSIMSAAEEEMQRTLDLELAGVRQHHTRGQSTKTSGKNYTESESKSRIPSEAETSSTSSSSSTPAGGSTTYSSIVDEKHIMAQREEIFARVLSSLGGPPTEDIRLPPRLQQAWDSRTYAQRVEVREKGSSETASELHEQTEMSSSPRLRTESIQRLEESFAAAIRDAPDVLVSSSSDAPLLQLGIEETELDGLLSELRRTGRGEGENELSSEMSWVLQYLGDQTLQSDSTGVSGVSTATEIRGAEEPVASVNDEEEEDDPIVLPNNEGRSVARDVRQNAMENIRGARSRGISSGGSEGSDALNRSSLPPARDSHENSPPLQPVQPRWISERAIEETRRAQEGEDKRNREVEAAEEDEAQEERESVSSSLPSDDEDYEEDWRASRREMKARILPTDSVADTDAGRQSMNGNLDEEEGGIDLLPQPPQRVRRSDTPALLLLPGPQPQRVDGSPASISRVAPLPSLPESEEKDPSH